MVQWSILTIGTLSRNRFWGESEEAAQRDVLCTATLLRTGRHNVVVDPSLPAEEMEACLFDASGLRVQDIDLVYLTHRHADHWVGLEVFEGARKCIAAGEYARTRGEGTDEQRAMLRAVQPVEGALCEGVELVELPGHTSGLTGLLFAAPEGRVLVCGDCVMTREFFGAREPYFFGQDLALNRVSIERAAQLADIIVPGHGNYFVVSAYR